MSNERRAAIRECLKVVESYLPRGNGKEEIEEILGSIVWDLRGLHGPFFDPRETGPQPPPPQTSGEEGGT